MQKGARYAINGVLEVRDNQTWNQKRTIIGKTQVWSRQTSA